MKILKKFLVTCISSLFIFNLSACDQVNQNIECDFIFYAHYTSAELGMSESYSILYEITNKTNKPIYKIKNLKVEIDFDYDIKCSIHAKDIKFNDFLLPYRLQNKKGIDAYTIHFSFKNGYPQFENDIKSISYKATYDIVYEQE